MGDIPDEVLLPLKDRLADWQDVDVAGYFLGKALGVIAPETSWGQAKGLFWTSQPIGMALIDTLRFLVDIGILEQREDYCEYRWPGNLRERPRAHAGHAVGPMALR
jgi:hypothetical protein